ncbi:MAG: ABC transporter permease [Thermoanaerobaculia bacterium]
MSRSIKSYLYLSYELIKRDVKGRYIGSSLGFFWSFLQPLLQLILFTFVFSYILKISLLGERGVENFSLFLFAGLLPWMGISEMLMRSTTSINEQASLIKKLAFPPELLIVSIMGSAMVHQFIASLLFIMVLIFMGKLYLSFLFLPVLMVFELIFISGFCFLFSSLNPYFKDTQQAVSYITMIWFYASPIVYPLSIVPEKFKKVLLLNPLSFLLEGFRDILLRGTLPSLGFFLPLLGPGLIFLFFGFWIFKKLRKNFADLL